MPIDQSNPLWEYVRPEEALREQMPAGRSVGKWCVFVKSEALKHVWESVCQAVEAGRLWRGAKISTPRGNASYAVRNGIPDLDEHVICVYTYDHRDKTDVMRVRQELRDIGIAQPLGYKTDADTVAGIERWTYQDEGLEK